MSSQPHTTSIISLIAMIVLSLVLVIQIGVMVGVLLKLRRVKVVALKYFGLIAMVAQCNNINDTGEYQSTITRTIDQHEIAFQADLDGDGCYWFKLGEYRNQRFL